MDKFYANSIYTVIRSEKHLVPITQTLPLSIIWQLLGMNFYGILSLRSYPFNPRGGRGRVSAVCTLWQIILSAKCLTIHWNANIIWGCVQGRLLSATDNIMIGMDHLIDVE